MMRDIMKNYESKGDTSFTKYAAFINDTIIMGNLSLTPWSSIGL